MYGIVYRITYPVYDNGNSRCRKLYFVSFTHFSSISVALISLRYNRIIILLIGNIQFLCLGMTIGLIDCNDQREIK